MNTMKPETDKATARPWGQNNWGSPTGDIYPSTNTVQQVLKGNNLIARCSNPANAALIVKAVNEREALLEVEKEARKLTVYGDNAERPLAAALANLATIRGKAK